nr:MAG TPA: hypothetical protein [Caudoviricetes sp.]
MCCIIFSLLEIISKNLIFRKEKITMDYLVNIILSNIQYFLWSMIVALIYAILSGRVEVILKITSKEIRLYIKKNFLVTIFTYVSQVLWNKMKYLPR